MASTHAALFFLLLGTLQTCIAQTISPTCKALLPAMTRSRIPDVALAVFSSGRVREDYCSVGAHSLQQDAVFEAASLSKPIFAAGVLTLVREGKLNLDTPLTSYLRKPYRHSRNPFNSDAPTDPVTDARLEHVTARMVLSHTTGLPNWDRTAALTFNADPGSKWGYSGEGYVYLQRIVEALTGKPLDEFLATTVLQPLGMTHSSFVWKDAYAANALSGHDKAGTAVPIARYPYAIASSTLYTTLSDYSRFVSALLSRWPGTVYAKEQEPQVTVRQDLQLAWGLGVAVEKSTGSVFHWGANPGFQGLFFVTPDTGKGILFLTDSDAGLDLINELMSRYEPGIHSVLTFPMLHPKD